VFKRVRSFGESKEKIVKIESNFPQSTIMDVKKRSGGHERMKRLLFLDQS
jgi:hypothetical protein